MFWLSMSVSWFCLYPWGALVSLATSYIGMIKLENLGEEELCKLGRSTMLLETLVNI